MKYQIQLKASEDAKCIEHEAKRKWEKFHTDDDLEESVEYLLLNMPGTYKAVVMEQTTLHKNDNPKVKDGLLKATSLTSDDAVIKLTELKTADIASFSVPRLIQ